MGISEDLGVDVLSVVVQLERGLFEIIHSGVNDRECGHYLVMDTIRRE